MSAINIRVDGLDKVMSNLAIVGRDLPKTLQGARYEISDAVLNTRGLRRYPPATDANRPPIPYYIRGRGMQYRNHNNGKSEKLGTRWQVSPYRQTGILIENPASYARYVHGEEQASAMARIGWRKLYDGALEKVPVITEIYNKWINKLIEKYGL